MLCPRWGPSSSLFHEENATRRYGTHVAVTHGRTLAEMIAYVLHSLRVQYSSQYSMKLYDSTSRCVVRERFIITKAFAPGRPERANGLTPADRAVQAVATVELFDAPVIHRFTIIRRAHRVFLLWGRVREQAMIPHQKLFKRRIIYHGTMPECSLPVEFQPPGLFFFPFANASIFISHFFGACPQVRKLWCDYSESFGGENRDARTSVTPISSVAAAQGAGARALRAFLDAVDLNDAKQAAVLQNLVRGYILYMDFLPLVRCIEGGGLSHGIVDMIVAL